MPKGRPKGSKNRPKEPSPLVEKKVVPITDKEAVAAVNAENPNQHTEIIGLLSYPSGWESMSKIQKLEWFTAQKK